MKAHFLSTEELRGLEAALGDQTTDRRLRARVEALLMIHNGEPRAQITQALQISARTLQRWIRVWKEGRSLECLTITWAPGRCPILDSSDVARVKTLAENPPGAVGIRARRWTYARLAYGIGQQFAIQISESVVRAFCRKHGIRPYGLRRKIDLSQ